jgi:hypothetical protein
MKASDFFSLNDGISLQFIHEKICANSIPEWLPGNDFSSWSNITIETNKKSLVQNMGQM